ncbi:MAG: hypothetical protein HUK40_10110 [Desulfobacter sp.]|nr:hypothetical protein [Desulfobacter sp.]WDP84392.1 MAG: hypothetical protein HUN05_03870 [Desulfobacter sp.]
MDKLLEIGAILFDAFRDFWHRESTHKTVSTILLVIFLASLGVIELNRQDFLPPSMADQIPTSHYMAINLAFLLVLIMEILGMILALPGSMSRALSKQFEILALIFLRNTFKELSILPEPISLSHHNEVIWHILSYGFGAIAIFALLGLFTAMQKNLDRVLAKGPSLDRFIAAKKNVALCMLITFCAMGVYNLGLKLTGQTVFSFFPSFYTVLIFSDVLMVLLAQTFLPQFPAVFRNSGYALATLLIRLSLTAPAYFSVVIGLSSVMLAVFLTLVYNKFYTFNSQG